METNKRPLMKHFSAVLRKRALSTVALNEPINPQILKFFTRKDLIQIIKDKYGGTIPKQHNLAELENQELLSIIGDDMYIISYITEKWSKEVHVKSIPVNKEILNKIDTDITKSVEKESKVTTKKETPPTVKLVKKK